MNAKQKIEQGFILAAGFGTRMMPLTADKPKPMVGINGRPMIDYVLDDFAAHGLRSVIVNTHYKASVLEDHLQSRAAPKIIISHEDDILETGGGLVHALPLMERKDFFISAGDSFLENGSGETAMTRLEQAWNAQEMDILILLQPISNMALTQGVGDYHLDGHGRACRAPDKKGSYMFTGLRINAPRIFDGAPQGAFSYLELLDKAEQAGRLYGLIHDGAWHHISTPEDVRALNTSLSQPEKEGAG